MLSDIAAQAVTYVLSPSVARDLPLLMFIEMC